MTTLASPRSEYLASLNARFQAYRVKRFADADVFDPAHNAVFRKAHVDLNVIVRPGAPDVQSEEVRRTIRPRHRHRWFGSMRSSQALAQSVFGNLIVLDRLHALVELNDEAGDPAFFPIAPSSHHAKLEFSCEQASGGLNVLCEPRRTSIDFHVSTPYRVAVECKFIEAEVGRCSRVTLKPADSNYEAQKCDGRYVRQRHRTSRCSLTELDIKYWEFGAEVFDWSPDRDHCPCPMASTYQLVRNVLSVCVEPSGNVVTSGRHVLLLYDDRNPAFSAGGVGAMAFDSARRALKIPRLLRRCSWQALVHHLRKDASLDFLRSELEAKYGF